MSIVATGIGSPLTDVNLPLTVDTSNVIAPIVTMRFVDSSSAYLSGVSTLDDLRVYMTANWPGSTMSVYVDDTYEFVVGGTPVKINPAVAWINAGHEFGTDGYSGDNFSVTAPIRMQYSGAEANPVLTISENGTKWAFSTDGSDAIAEFDVSKGSTLEGYNVGILGLNVPPVDRLRDYILSKAGGVFSIDSNGSGGYDDTYTYIFSDGVYAEGDFIPYDADRRWYEEINVSIAEISELPGLTYQKTYLYRNNSNVQQFENYARNYGVLVAGSAVNASNQGIDMTTRPSNFLDLQITEGKGTIINWPTTEQAIRDDVDALLLDNASRWIIMEIPIQGNGTWENQQSIYMADQFAARGCQMMSVIDAYNWFLNNT